MIIHAFSIFDRDTGAYNVPFFQPHIAIALRSFKAVCNDPTTVVNKSPGSFELRYLGTFNDQLGQFTGETNPEIIASAVNMVEPTTQLDIPFNKESAA